MADALGLRRVSFFEDATGHTADHLVGLLAFLADDPFGLGPFGAPLGEAVH